jgi:hypothetical protein
MPRRLEIDVLLRLARGGAGQKSEPGRLDRHARISAKFPELFLICEGEGPMNCLLLGSRYRVVCITRRYSDCFVDGTRYRLSYPNINRRNVADRG